MTESVSNATYADTEAFRAGTARSAACTVAVSTSTEYALISALVSQKTMLSPRSPVQPYQERKPGWAALHRDARTVQRLRGHAEAGRDQSRLQRPLLLRIPDG